MAVIARGGRALDRLPALSLPAAGRATPWRLALLACLALAALSLLGPHETTYDPTAWLIWGREIVHADLSTISGPSWKPLPVIFTTPFALFGHTAAPLLWLIVARAGGLFSFVLVYRLASRLAGRTAGLIAVASVVVENVFIFHFARGNSEGLQAAVTLWAIERHLDGRPRDAFLLGVASGLLRPEMWPIVGVYGLWLVAASWREAPPWRTIALVGGAGVGLLALWFVPEYIGSGSLLRSATRAAVAVEGSPQQAAVPFLATFTNAASALLVPTYVGGVAAVAFAVRRGREGATVLALAALSTLLMLSVAVGAQVGFTGNQRYVTLPASIVCVLAGVGWVQAAAAVRRRAGVRAAWALVVVAVAGSVPFAISGVNRLRDRLDVVRTEADHYGALPTAIAAAGGEAAVKRCGTVYTGPYDTQAVAWDLHLHQYQVGIEPMVPGTTIFSSGSPRIDQVRFPTIVRSGGWTIGSSCPRR